MTVDGERTVMSHRIGQLGGGGARVIAHCSKQDPSGIILLRDAYATVYVETEAVDELVSLLVRARAENEQHQERMAAAGVYPWARALVE
jgi:hypothetical protein